VKVRISPLGWRLLIAVTVLGVAYTLTSYFGDLATAVLNCPLSSI